MSLRAFETSVLIYHRKRRNTPEDLNLQQDHCQNFKSRTLWNDKGGPNLVWDFERTSNNGVKPYSHLRSEGVRLWPVNLIWDPMEVTVTTNTNHNIGHAIEETHEFRYCDSHSAATVSSSFWHIRHFASLWKRKHLQLLWKVDKLLAVAQNHRIWFLNTCIPTCWSHLNRVSRGVKCGTCGLCYTAWEFDWESWCTAIEGGTMRAMVATCSFEHRVWIWPDTQPLITWGSLIY